MSFRFVFGVITSETGGWNSQQTCGRIIILANHMGIIGPFEGHKKRCSIWGLLAEWIWSELRFLIEFTGFTGFTIEKDGDLTSLKHGRTWCQLQLEASSRKSIPARTLSVLEFGFHRTWNTLLDKGDISSEKNSLGMTSTTITSTNQRGFFECWRHIRTMGSFGFAATKENLPALTQVPKRVSTILIGLKSTWSCLKLKQYIGMELVCKVGCFALHRLSVLGPFGPFKSSHVVLCWGYSRSPDAHGFPWFSCEGSELHGQAIPWIISALKKHILVSSSCEEVQLPITRKGCVTCQEILGPGNLRLIN